MEENGRHCSIKGLADSTGETFTLCFYKTIELDNFQVSGYLATKPICFLSLEDTA